MQDKLQLLENYFKEKNDVVMAFVFGSHAQKRARYALIGILQFILCQKSIWN